MTDEQLSMGLSTRHLLVLLIVACCTVDCCGQLQWESKKMAFNDALFNAIGLQLITPPPASHTALAAAAASGRAPVNAPEVEAAVNTAKAWVMNILRKEFHPGTNTVFLAIRREAGICDVVRAMYSAGGFDLEVAQTFSLFSVKVRNASKNASEPEEKHMEEIAEMLLNTDQPVSFLAIASEGPIVYGRQRAPHDPFECDWVELLRWWTSNDSLGFLTVKTTKSPEKAVVGPGESANTNWFDLYKRL